MKSLAIIMPVYNGLNFTKRALANLSEAIENVKKDILTISLIVVDDGSTDGTSEFIRKEYPDTIIMKGDGSLWWSGGMNYGARFACDEIRSDYIALWNNDITCKSDYFSILNEIINNSDDQVIIGSKIYASNNLVWSMGGFYNPFTGKKTQLGWFMPDDQVFEKTVSVDWLPGMGTILHTDVIRKIGYWDNISFPQYHGDSDFTYRAKLAGYKIIVYPRLKLWNDISNTGIEHKGNLKTLLHSLRHIKSYNNIRIDLLFYKKYAKSPYAYLELLKKYGRLIGGYFKWKVLNFIGINKQQPAQ
jgi:GT2 family glycosyltransferase